jgi:flavin-dependent dehydrogenase
MFIGLVETAGLDPEKYILRRVDNLIMDEVKIPADLMTINKPGLIRDLLQGLKISRTPLDIRKYDRIIDATGVFRAFLPKIDRDIVLRCAQCRVRTEEDLPNRIRLGEIGYSWCFPLAAHGYHLGCGSLLSDPHKIIKELHWLEARGSRRGPQVICRCEGKIRLTAPHYSQPFVIDQAPGGIWGVGEAIGCVAPLAGDGIVPGMRSVQILLDHWNDPVGYRTAILEEFHWMKREREVLNKLIRGRALGLRDALVLKRNSKRMGMKIGLHKARILMKRIR